MKKIKISKKDVKLLLIVLSLAFLWLTYSFIYSDNMKKVDVVNGDIDKLENRYSDLQKKVNDKEKIIKENNSLQQNFDLMVKSYGNGASEEKNIIFLKALEDNTAMEINSASFSDPIILFNGSNMVVDKSQSSDLKSATNELSKATGDKPATENINQIDAKKLEGLKDLSGYCETISITFRSTYDGFKKCLDYINNYPEKCNVGDVTASYDTETGNISGTMIINMYHLKGKGVTYQAPEIGEVGISTNNIFGTIEIPTKNDKNGQ